ncbi:MAG: ADP-glyceromanno-heptose 6-epimerase [Methylophilaceae bacterium]|jgi:ADP-L-glycero-D-manno-heptose 6-epimerase
MIIITGGAGMIGSMIAWHLDTIMNEDQLIIVDDYEDPSREKNFSKRKYSEFIHKKKLFDFLKDAKKIRAVIHMGAISATVEKNFNNLLNSNIRYSQKLWSWCASHNVPFIYASSAATYGDGRQGYDDGIQLNLLNPLNAYGYSKHFFDQWAELQVKSNQPAPPQWVGLKFFNVYGPNEYHKGRMASVVYHAFNQMNDHQEIKLFKSDRHDYDDGMQMRDFIYVKDAVKCVMFFLQNNSISGLYNVGTGKAQSFKKLATAVAQNMKANEDVIKYIDMPDDLKNKYQYFTEAKMNKLRDIGYEESFFDLNLGVQDYIENYLSTKDMYA